LSTSRHGGLQSAVAEVVAKCHARTRRVVGWTIGGNGITRPRNCHCAATLFAESTVGRAPSGPAHACCFTEIRSPFHRHEDVLRVSFRASVVHTVVRTGRSLVLLRSHDCSMCAGRSCAAQHGGALGDIDPGTIHLPLLQFMRSVFTRLHLTHHTQGHVNLV
jgi:hypothetical protein